MRPEIRLAAKKGMEIINVTSKALFTMSDNVINSIIYINFNFLETDFNPLTLICYLRILICHINFSLRSVFYLILLLLNSFAFWVFVLFVYLFFACSLFPFFYFWKICKWVRYFKYRVEYRKSCPSFFFVLWKNHHWIEKII